MSSTCRPTRRVELRLASGAVRAGRRAAMRAGLRELVVPIASLAVGRHRFFLNLTYAGRTHTAPFTQEVTS